MNIDQKRWWSVNWFTIALVMILLLVALIRYRFLAMPFEWDEGEYAYMGNLILHGGMPYRDAYNMKLPGTFCMYSLIIAFFGAKPIGVHLGLMIISLITIVLFYTAFKKLFSPMVALVAAAVYGLLSVSMRFFGFAAHATHFVNLFLAIALCFYAGFVDNKRPLYSFLMGLMLGLAFLVKQQAAFLILFGGIMVITICLLIRPVNWKKLLTNTSLYAAGVFLPYLVVLIVVLATGAFNKFWFWTVTYAHVYINEYVADKRNLSDIIPAFGVLYNDFKIIWLLALSGLAVVWINKYSRDRKIFVILLVLFSLASVCPGYYFRLHYFVVIIPAVALLIGILLEFIVDINPAGRYKPAIAVLPFVIICLVGIISISTNWYYYHDADLHWINVQCYGMRAFTIAPEIGRYIESNSSPQDKIALLGNEPEILVYANRWSATRYIYTYPLVEQQKYNRQMQQEMISEIMAAKPKYLVFENLNWQNLWPSTPADMVDWYSTYVPANYELVGLVDIAYTSRCYWNEAADRVPAGENFVKVFRRKEPV